MEAPLAISKLKEFDTKMVVMFSDSPSNLKAVALNCGVPIFRDHLQSQRDKALEFDNPLEIDPAARSLLIPGWVPKEQLKSALAYDRIYVYRYAVAGLFLLRVAEVLTVEPAGLRRRRRSCS